MAKAKGVQTHPFFKLGKAPAKRDARNLMFATILKAVKVPAEYDFDVQHKGVPMPMFGNDEYGDCVIAGRAHQTLRFELVEQKKIIKITDADVEKEYFKETGGPDSGLVPLDSLKLWRKRGWRAAGKTYKIKAFAQIEPKNHPQIRQAVFGDVGIGIGLLLPLSAQNQINAGKPWDVVSGSSAKPNSWGGHYVHIPGYTKDGPVCVTWGRKQQMTWRFLDKYCDEAYAIIDAVNTAKKKAAINVKKLETFLASL